MGSDHERTPNKVSLRDLAAAWACCGFVALGALLIGSVDRRHDAADAVYAGARIPSDGGSRRNMRSEEEADDDATEDLPDSIETKGSPSCPTREVVAYSKSSVAPPAASSALSIC
jgi:hypothetical protein